MKTIAFAGQYHALTELVKKYTGRNYHLDIMHHDMANGENIKILVSKNPNGKEFNPYQWTQGAERIFVCIDLMNDDFSSHFDGELQLIHDNNEKLVLIAFAKDFNSERYMRLKEFALFNNNPLIYCFENAKQAHCVIDGNEYQLDFNEIVDKFVNNSFVVAQEEIPVVEHEERRRRCRIM